MNTHNFTEIQMVKGYCGVQNSTKTVKTVGEKKKKITSHNFCGIKKIPLGKENKKPSRTY